MRYNEYDIRPYCPRDIAGAADILTHLYAIDAPVAADYLRWKYEENPFSSGPLAVVAAYDGKIVGFRAFYASKWQVGHTDRIITTLSSSDVCVHPDHRRKGLFRAMTDFSLGLYQHHDYDAYINISSNQYSTPCDLKTGWVKVSTVRTLRKCSLLALIKYALTQKLGVKTTGFALKSGRFDDIEVTNQPDSYAMQRVFDQQNRQNDRITLCRNLDLFQWQFRNNLKKYVFCYLRTGGSVNAYLILAVRRYTPPNTNRAAILDFAQSHQGALSKILRHITNQKSSNIFDLRDYCMNLPSVNDFVEFGFSYSDWTLKLQDNLRGHRYLMVRPIKKEYNESDWIVCGRDIRDPHMWDIKEICSDDA